MKYSICNKYLFNNLIIDDFSQSKFFLVKKILTFFINLNFFFNRSLALLINNFFNIKLNESFFFSFMGIIESYYDSDKKEKLNKKDNVKVYDFFFQKNNIYLDNNTDLLCEKLLKKINLDNDQDFVCLHVREGVYRNDYNRRPYRNSNIQNYYELIKFLCSKNIFVIRMGRLSNKPLEIKHKMIFDLPFSEFKFDYFDLYLLKNCKFFIGDHSGLTDAAVLLNKDCLKTNMLRIFELPPTTVKSRSICKIPFFKKDKKTLNLTEYLNLPYLYHHPEFIDKELDFLENSSEDLYLAAKEYHDLIYNDPRNINTSLLTDIQKKFNILLLNRFSDMYFEKDNNLDTFYRKYALLRWLKSTRGAHSSFFLEKYLTK